MSLLKKINETVYKGIFFTVALSVTVKNILEIYKNLKKEVEEKETKYNDEDVIEI